MGLFKTVAEKIESGADWVEKTGVDAVDTTLEAGYNAVVATKNAAVWAKDKVVDAALWTKDRVLETAVWTKDKAVEAAEWTKDKATETAGWIKDKAVLAKEWGVKKAKQLDNAVAGALAKGIAEAVTKYKPVEMCLEAALSKIDESKSDPLKVAAAKKVDGQFMGNDCPVTSIVPPQQGRMPQGCPVGAALPKIIYTNGIQTSPEAACATMRKMANQQCAQVIGVYNASFGMIKDILDSKKNIDRAGTEKAAHSQAQLISDMLNSNPPQPVTLYAHSQGGLITQEGLQEAYTSMHRETAYELKQQGMSQEQAQQEATIRTKAKMSQVTVRSFGTAETGWPPVGASYYQMTNTADPVPKLIHAVQANRGTNTQPANLKGRHRFEQNEWDPIGAHSMDNAYLPELNRTNPVPKKANGGCC